MLAVLADELNDHILEQCALQPRSEPELMASSGAVRNTVRTRLATLQAHGLLVGVVHRDGSMGRPVTRFKPLSAHDADGFERTADAFVLALLDAQGADQRAAIDARRKRDLQISSDEAAETTAGRAADGVSGAYEDEQPA